MNTGHSLSRHMRTFTLKPLVALLLSALALQAHAASSYTDLGTLGGIYSNGYGLSADGTTVVGASYYDGTTNQQAFRWNNGTMTGLGFLGTGKNSNAYAVSSDGATVVGASDYDPTGNLQAFRWNNGTMTGLGFLGAGKNSNASAVSADGTTVVGDSNYDDTFNTQAFRWNNGTMTGLGFLGTGKNSQVQAVSADGTTVVGASNYDGTFNTQAFRWNNGTMAGLGFLGIGVYSQANAVSADGAIVVGNSSYDGTGNVQAFRWKGGTMTGLGFLGTGNSSSASAVSADGTAVVGNSSYDGTGNVQAYQWKGGTMTGLGFLGTGNYSVAYAVSVDGAAVVGSSSYDSTSNTQAFRWTSGVGMQSITQWLAAAGVTAPAALAVNSVAYGVSANGQVVMGNTYDGTGHSLPWLARVDPAGNGYLPDINAYNLSLMRAAPNLPNLAMFGAHHRSILDNGLAKTSSDGACGWATVDGGRYDNIHTREQLAEVGVCKDFGTTRVGVGIGQAWFQQNLSLNGSARYDGQYLLAEGAKQFDNGLQPSVTGYYGHFDANMARNYVNGAAVDSSSAKTKAHGYALRARLDWKDAAQLGRFNLSPYAAYTWMKTKVDGYTETGGGFPAYFASSSLSTDDVRVGLAAKTPLSPSTDLRLGAEVVHRLEENVSGINGQVIGLWSFSVNTPQITQNWTRATADLDHRFTDKIAMTLGVLGATSGNDASWSVTAGLRANF